MRVGTRSIKDIQPDYSTLNNRLQSLDIFIPTLPYLPYSEFIFAENYIGMTLVMLGTTICMVAKVQNETTPVS